MHPLTVLELYPKKKSGAPLAVRIKFSLEYVQPVHALNELSV
jgi:hypothetical protein